MKVRQPLTVGGMAAALILGVMPGQVLGAAPSADVNVSVTAAAGGIDPSTVAVGADAPFDVFIGNAGPDTVTTSLTLTLAGGTITSAKPDASIVTHCTVVSNTKLTCTTAAISDSGRGAFIVVHTKAAKAGTITASGSVSSADPDPFTSDNTSSDVITAVVPPPSTVTASLAPTTVIRGHAVTVTGAIKVSGNGVADASMILQRRPTGTTTWHRVNSGYTGDDGRLSLTDVPQQPSDYRYVHPNDPIAAAATSPVVSVAMTPSVRDSLSPTVVPPGYPSTMTARVTPHDPGAVATLQQLRRGTWTTIRTERVSSAGLASWSIPAPRSGSFSYRVALAAAPHLSARVGKTVALKVTTKGLGKASAYSFLSRYNGHPMRWNPCQAIGYKVNAAQGPTGALATVKETLRRIHLASGLRFRYEGKTSTHPRWGFVHHQAAPLVIAWVTAKHSDGLFNFGGDIGFGGATESLVRDGHEVIVQGGALLLASSSPAAHDLGAGFGSGNTWGELLMHELGHAMGLNHTSGKDQIMQPILQRLPAAMYGAGDLHGLHLLGRSQGCLR